MRSGGVGAPAPGRPRRGDVARRPARRGRPPSRPRWRASGAAPRRRPRPAGARGRRRRSAVAGRGRPSAGGAGRGRRRGTCPASTWSRTPLRRSRRRSSPAASRVNVRASVWRASAVPMAMRWAIRVVSTRVLPEPAPAMTATSVDGVVTAAAWAGSRPASAAAARRALAGDGLGGRRHPATLRRGTDTVGAMPYPKKLLNDYETLALDLHPHWWYFVEAAVALAGAVVFGIVVLAAGWPRARSSGSPSCSSSAARSGWSPATSSG